MSKKLTIKKLWLKLRYKIFINCDSSMLPRLGKGKNISVLKKGEYLDIVNECTKDFIRLIPYQPNHGIMVEWHKKGAVKSSGRQHMDFQFFKKYLRLGEENG